MGFIAAGIIAGGMIAGSYMQSQAAKKAASAQAGAADKATQAQLEMYYQGRADLAPWRESGGWAVNQLAGLISAGPGGAYTPQTYQPGVSTPAAGIPQTPQTAQTGYEDMEIINTNRLGGQERQAYLQGKQIIGPAIFDGIIIPSGYSATVARENESGPPDLNFRVSDQLKTPTVPSSVSGQVDPSGSFQLGTTEGAAPLGQLDSSGGFNLGTAEQIPSGMGADWTEKYQQSPYYDFLLQQGIQAQERGAASKGMLASGAEQKALTQYGQNMASMDYDNWLRRWYESLAPWQSLAGVGQTSAGQTANLAAKTGQGIAQTGMASGQAQAAGYLGQGQIWGNALNQLGNVGAQAYYGSYGQGYANPYMNQLYANRAALNAQTGGQYAYGL